MNNILKGYTGITEKTNKLDHKTRKINIKIGNKTVNTAIHAQNMKDDQ